jgi:hypothetical protein
MARIVEPTPEQESDWKQWVSERPDVVRLVAERFDPWSLYRMKSTGQRVTLYSFSEDGTVTVNVSGDYNFVLFERSVFGVDPDDLEPCEVPPPNEHVGTLISHKDVEENIEGLLALIRPDLYGQKEDA